MAPYADHAPSSDAEQLANAPVSFLVACDFKAPVLAIVAGHPAVPSAAVPETAVNENSEALVSKDEIGADGNSRTSDAQR
jgi:hypothetical protein